MKQNPKFKLNNETVRIVKELLVRDSQPGKRDVFHPLVDKDGTWVQVEILDGDRKGFLVPVTKESLK